MPRSEWQVPPGVSTGAWDYFESNSVAADYDAYFEEHPLFRLDQEWLIPLLQGVETVVDLGCGTGRALLPLVARGVRGIGVDLSQPMLTEVQRKAQAAQLPVWVLRANLVELDALADNTCELAICLFSTLGMIRGSAQRAQAVRHFARILRPGGTLVLHVHNLWSSLWDPGGWRRLAADAFRSWRDPTWELGDRIYPYRGVSRMYLHSFRWHELRALLRHAGLEITHFRGLDARLAQALPPATWFPHWRASGWMLTARKPTTGCLEKRPLE